MFQRCLHLHTNVIRKHCQDRWSFSISIVLNILKSFGFMFTCQHCSSTRNQCQMSVLCSVWWWKKLPFTIHLLSCHIVLLKDAGRVVIRQEAALHPGKVTSWSQGTHKAHSHISVSILPKVHVFELWDQTRVLGENQHRHSKHPLGKVCAQQHWKTALSYNIQISNAPTDMPKIDSTGRWSHIELISYLLVVAARNLMITHLISILFSVWKEVKVVHSFRSMLRFL